ncbi:ABC transporter permease, partial [Enterococcus hirae]
MLVNFSGLFKCIYGDVFFNVVLFSVKMVLFGLLMSYLLVYVLVCICIVWIKFIILIIVIILLFLG